MADKFTAKFWGVRGSIPTPGIEFTKYGGNTACIELRIGEKDRLIIIDAGSGIRLLAGYMMKNDFPKGPMSADIFLSHTHWDHILGFPFFVPNFIKGTKLRIYGPQTYEEETLEKIIGNQLSYRYFPIRQEELSAQIEYLQLKECEMDLGDGIKLKTKYLNHPVSSLGYRFEYQGKVFCTAYDNEPFYNLFPTDPTDPDYDEDVAREGENTAFEENKKIREFYRDADVLVHDAQYTNQEYKKNRKGWGHSSFEYAINSAHNAKVKKLFLFHHDIARTDKELDELEIKYRNKIQGKTSMEISLAKEGMEIVLI